MKIKSLLAIACVWLLFGALHLLSTYLDRIKATTPNASVSDSEVFYYLSAYVSWSLICYLNFIVTRRIVSTGKYSTLPYLFIVGIAVWLPTFFIIDMKIGAALGIVPDKSFAAILKGISYQIVFFYFVVYSLMFGLCIAISLYDYSKRVVIEKLQMEKLEAQSRSRLSELQMSALQSHLSPHFLFNSLGSISALARQDDKEAVISAVARLGDLLRIAVEANKKITIPIESEIEFSEHYIALQKLRFSDRFTFSLKQEEKTPDGECPPFAIQILVENAFIHSVSQSDDIVNIDVIISDGRGVLTIEVVNTISENTTASNGLGSGLSNLKERLFMIYGNDARLTTKADKQQFIATVSIPQKELE